MIFEPPGDCWPHQASTLTELYQRVHPGCKLHVPGSSLCVTGPTGSGKTRMMSEVLRFCTQHGLKGILYTHRRILLEQTSRRLESDGIKYGIRASGYDPQPYEDIQIASIQTDDSRVLKRDKWSLHPANVVLIDEAHTHTKDTIHEIVQRYREAGAVIIGFTATPLGIGHLYDELITSGNVRALIDQGILVKAEHFGPDEPDLAKIRRTQTGEYKHDDVIKAIMTHSIFGRVLDNWHILNPEQKPTVLFAPGVKESIWFAEELTKSGVPTAHIDGKDAWVNGHLYKSSNDVRDEIFAMLREGDIKIVSNRFVLREGWDAPYARHLIFATIFGALTSYVQSGGRGMRSDNDPYTIAKYGPKEFVTIQDHGGAWHSHGSLNQNRTWNMELTDYIVTSMHEDSLREKKEPEPICCPRCFAIRLSGESCYQCGYRHETRGRLVVQHNGTLKHIDGPIYRPRRTYDKQDLIRKWRQYYNRALRAKMTFKQACSLFAMENYWAWPPTNLPLMPIHASDWYLSVDRVPVGRLNPDSKSLGNGPSKTKKPKKEQQKNLPI
jgi:superfamily II DNA or RNA helicase